ncbi:MULTISPECIES: type II toxin-antitoxin system HicB family antitoxin [Pandoraea]|uniref:HicB family protein n=1 Tax=Pandoraea iniqua TaxID=2508288 RepID=A0A5E4UBN0_9BURK|nr:MULTISPECIES: type II toxin-antitoxin system HicB family antitoxin [Pandoraea]VVD93240.1 HicB family protein [Pandoraea iniqua]VVD97456.1 HicB family protein [Pandoraea iniqua]
MEFPIAIHKDEGSTYGVTVPDVPGCFSWGDTIDEAIRNAKEAISGHIETLIAQGEEVSLTCSAIEDLAKQEAFADAIWAFADVDISKLDSKPERINVSFPRFVLHKIDAYVAKRHETRSGFLARVAMAAIVHEA